MEKIADVKLREILQEMGELLKHVYGNRMKYVKVFSIIDVKYQEYQEWKTVSPFYKNVDREGVVVYAA